MGLELADEAIILVDAALVGRRARTFVAARPLAEHAGGITVLLHDLRQNNVTRIVGFLSHNGIFIIVTVLHQRRIGPIFFVSTHMPVA